MSDLTYLSKWNVIIEPVTKYNQSYGGLYLADIDSAQDIYLLQRLNIGAILTLLDEPQIIVPNFVTHMVIDLPDSQDQNLIKHLPECCKYIDEKRKITNVMVHCYAGISRSASVVIAYLMEHFQWSLDKSYQIVKCLRNQIKPNDGFLNQLRSYEQIYLSTVESIDIEQEIKNRQKLIENLKKYSQ